MQKKCEQFFLHNWRMIWSIMSLVPSKRWQCQKRGGQYCVQAAVKEVWVKSLACWWLMIGSGHLLSLTPDSPLSAPPAPHRQNQPDPPTSYQDIRHISSFPISPCNVGWFVESKVHLLWSPKQPKHPIYVINNMYTRWHFRIPIWILIWKLMLHLRLSSRHANCRTSRTIILFSRIHNDQ